MKNITSNTIKTIIGYFAGTGLLILIYHLNPFIISAIQWLFFTLLYTFLDWLIDKYIKRRNRNWLVCGICGKRIKKENGYTTSYTRIEECLKCVQKNI